MRSLQDACTHMTEYQRTVRGRRRFVSRHCGMTLVAVFVCVVSSLAGRFRSRMRRRCLKDGGSLRTAVPDAVRNAMCNCMLQLNQSATVMSVAASRAVSAVV